MTNVPLGPTTNSQELNRDEGHTVTNSSCCHSLIKPLGATEHSHIHLGENIAKVAQRKSNPFSYKETSNHRLLHSAPRYQSPKLSGMTSLTEKRYTKD